MERYIFAGVANGDTVVFLHSIENGNYKTIISANLYSILLKSELIRKKTSVVIYEIDNEYTDAIIFNRQSGKLELDNIHRDVDYFIEYRYSTLSYNILVKHIDVPKIAPIRHIFHCKGRTGDSSNDAT